MTCNASFRYGKGMAVWIKVKYSSMFLYGNDTIY